MKQAETTAWPWRAAVLSSIVVLPFVRFLCQNEYPLYEPDALVAGGAMAGVCIGLALILRRPFLFGAVASLVTVLTSANTVRALLAPLADIRWRIVVPFLLLLAACAAYSLGPVFYKAVVVFCLAAAAVDVVQALNAPRPQPASLPAGTTATSRPEHVIYIIFDEHIGPEGLPRQFPESRRAKAAAEGVLLRNSFDYYPYAYTNYSSTFRSIPSILNRIPLAAAVRDKAGRQALGDNALVREYLSRGYAVRVYDSDALRLAPDGLGPAVTRVTYKANSVGALTRVCWPWPAKLRQIAGSYLQSDVLWSDIGRSTLFSRVRFHQQRVGPLAIIDIWPDTLLADIRNARRNTLFLAHLLTPHYPYVYHSDGRWRDRDDWETDDLVEPLPAALYERRQRQYAEQVEWLSVQLESFLTGLRSSGLYDSTRIVIHGDHGSRIRLSRDCDRALRKRLEASGRVIDWADLYDYAAEPDLQELLNRFSTLLAIKRPGARSARVDPRKGSVPRFLSEALYGGSPSGSGQDAGSVYLFDISGRPIPIGLAQRWVSSDHARQPSL